MKRPALVYLAPLIVAILTAAGTLSLYPFVHFARPRALWLLLALVGLSLVWAHRAQRRGRVRDALMHVHAVKRLAHRWSPRRDSARFALTAVACFGLIIASAQPQWGEQTRRVQRKGTDVVIVLDASRSMLAEDMSPNRMKAATHELSNLLSFLEGDRVGLVVFAGVAFTQSPLTSDYGAIRLYLDRVNPDAIPAQGTSIGLAIKEAHKLLTGGDNPDFRRAPQQMILVLSDGEDHETQPVEAAYAAHQDGILTYTVGIGTSAGGRIPLTDRNGQFARYLTDRDGEVVRTTLADEQLHEIAAAGGGSYAHFDGINSTAPALAATIQGMDAAHLSSALRAHYVNRGAIFLWPAFLLLLLALLIDDRPRTQRPRKWWNILLVLLVASTVSSCLDFRYEDPHVRRAIEHAEDDNYEDALAEIAQANSDARTQHAYHFNRGRIYAGHGDIEEAQDDFLSALGASALSLRVASLIGVGNTLVAQENYRDAMTRYTRALRLDPANSTARHNLEIAHRKQFPLCRALEDPYEPNDRLADAEDLPSNSISGAYASLYTPPDSTTLNSATPPSAPTAAPSASTDDEEDDASLVLCGSNEDWFKLPLQGGESVQVTATLHRLRDDNGGPPLPPRIPANAIRMRVVNTLGKRVAADSGRSQDRDAEGNVSARRLTRSLDIPPVNPNDAPFFLVLSADNDLEYRYELDVEITPPCSALEDDFEPNDSIENAHTIENGEHQARICNDNEDWFHMDLEEGDHLFVDVTPAPTEDTDDPRIRSGFGADSETRIALKDQATPGRIAWASNEIAAAHAARWGIASQDNLETAYSMDVYRFGACPEGNDRFEPNDRPNEAASLSAEQSEIRHLRLCPNDQDWFVMNLSPDEDADANDMQAFSARVDFDQRTPIHNVQIDHNVQIELWDPTTGRRLAGGQPILEDAEGQHTDTGADVDEADDQTKEIEPAEDASTPDARNTEARAANEPTRAATDATVEQPRGKSHAVIAATEIPANTEAVVLRVSGDETFYHLSFPDTVPPESSETEDAKDSDDDTSEDQNQADGDASNDDASDGEDEDANDEPSDDKDAQDAQNAPDENAEQDGGDDEQPRDDSLAQDPYAPQPEDIPEAAPSDEEEQRRALMELLNSLEHDEVNLQLHQAMEREPPPSQPTKEW